MKIKADARKIAELGVGAIALVTLILAGCGGGGGGGGASAPAGTTATIVPFKGMFRSGTISLADSSGNTVPILSGASINASGVATVTYSPTVQYPLVVSVTGSYINEAKGGATESTVAPLRGFVASSSVAAAPAGIPVTAITELAVAQVQLAVSGVAGYTISNNNVTTAINNVVSELGIPNTVPSFDANGNATDGNTAALQGIALAIGAHNPGANLSASLSTVGQNLAAALANGPASSVAAAAVVATYVPNLTSHIATAVANNSATLPASPTIPAGPPLSPPSIVSVGVPTSAAATQIASATTLLNNLNAVFLKQASGVQADLNNINSPFQEAQNFSIFLYQGMMLASNGSLTNTALHQSVTVNGYPCVLTSVSSGTGTVVCQWANNNVNTGPTIHQLTITGTNVSSGTLDLTPQGSYTWSDTIIPGITLSTVNSAIGVSVTGVTATGTVAGTGANVVLNGSILPGAGPTSTDSLTTLTNLSLTAGTTAGTNGAHGTITYVMTGTIAEMAGSSTVDSITLSTGTQVVQDAVNYHTISATLVTQASTQNYGFNGTLTMTNFAQDKLSSTHRNPGWNPGSITFTGNISGINGNASAGQFLVTTGAGVTITSDRTQYDPTQPVSSTNFPTQSGTFVGNVVSGTSTYSLNLSVYTGTSSSTYNTGTTTLTYSDSSNNAVTVTGTATGLTATEAASITATLSGNNTGSVYSGSAATGTPIGTITNGVVSFIDNSTLTLQ